jgi:hypothetical protein
LLRSDLVAFIHRAFPDFNPQALFMPAPYIELMVSRLEDCRSGKSRRLIINLPGTREAPRVDPEQKRG